MNLYDLTITQAHEGLASKTFTATELLDSVLGRIHAADSSVHAYLSLHEDIAHKQAEMVDEKISKGHQIGMLEGVPAAIKDNILIKGSVTTSASQILKDYVASYDATVIEKLTSAHAVFVGKTNMDEFAMGSSTENSAFGLSKNPWDISRVPGGSSGGSAAAVAAGECMYALGSDTGGSIRQPASLCGIVGLKPTYGQVSRYGVMAMASSLDQIGPMTKTVEDAAIVYDAIRGVDTHDSTTAQSSPSIEPTKLNTDLSGIRIGIPREYFMEGLDPRVESAVRQAAKDLQDRGATLVDISLPHSMYALSVYYIIMPAEVCANMSRYDGMRYGHREQASDLWATYMTSREKGLGAEVRRRIMLGTYVLSAGYADQYYSQAQKVRSLIRRDFDQAFTQVDCILGPTSPTPAFRIGEKTTDPLTMYLADIFTVSANIAGIPALSLPCGFAQENGVDLPIGMQLSGKHFDEQTILSVGHAYQQITDWHTCRATIA